MHSDIKSDVNGSNSGRSHDEKVSWKNISELLLLSWILPAIASITNIGMNLPAHITIAVETFP